MPITANGYYNDPSIGQAFAGLAQAFRPPSGTELAGYALANERKQKADQLGQLFNYARGPNFDQTQFDRLGVAAGQWTPSQGYYGVDSNRAGELDRAMLAPVSKDATRFVPKNIADYYGTDPIQTGVVSVNPGENAHLPNGSVIEGAPKPLTKSEVEGNILSGLPQDDQRASVLSDIPVESVIMGGRPQVVRRSDAVGQTPYSADAGALVEGTANIGGKVVQVFRKKNETVYSTADGTPLPPDTQVFDKARPVGTNEQVGMKNTESGDKAGMFYNRAAQANDVMKKSSAAGYVPSPADFELMLGGAGDTLPLSLSNNLVSPEGRAFYNSGMNFMMSVLRPDTGAAFGKKEFQDYSRIFLPLPGDDPQTLQNKAVARDTALAALQGTSRGAADAITRIMQNNGVPVPPEMLRHMQNPNAGQPAGGAPAPAASAAGGATERWERGPDGKLRRAQ